MSTTTNGPSTKLPQATGSSFGYGAEAPSEKGAGWIVFASTMFVIAACLNFIWGFAAIANSHFFVANASYVISDLNTWGWILIGFATLELLTAVSVFRGGAFGRWFGMFIAGVAVVLAMLTIPAYPLWALTLVAIDLLVIYGLAAYGGNPELTR